MTVNFENDNDVIVYALEKIIAYGRKNQYIFVAQSVWWIASIVGLTKGLVIHIDTLRINTEVSQLSINAVSVTPWDLQEHFRIDINADYIHPDRISRVRDQTPDSSGLCEWSSHKSLRIKEKTNKFISGSQKERKALLKRLDPLSRTRSGNIPVRPLTKKQRNRLQAIPKDKISAYLASRD